MRYIYFFRYMIQFVTTDLRSIHLKSSHIAAPTLEITAPLRVIPGVASPAGCLWSGTFLQVKKNVWVPVPVRLLIGKKPRTSSPMSTKTAFPWVYTILPYLCLGSENKSSSKLEKKKKKIKVDNDHAREC